MGNRAHTPTRRGNHSVRERSPGDGSEVVPTSGAPHDVAAPDDPTNPADDTEVSWPRSDEPAPSRVGSTLGRYRLDRELGRGGMGVVYEAHDPDLDRRVALKVLLARRDSVTLQRMGREARAVAKLSHPNVVQIFDVCLTGDSPYLVMEYLEGSTLREWSEAGGRSWARRVKAHIEAGRGLAAAHAVGLVHRDFKPANAIVDRKGHVTVLDFGLATAGGDFGAALDDQLIARNAESTLTRTGTAMGTPRYMAPEQHRGERPDARADIYSLGVALYTALYGARAFQGTSNANLYHAKRAGVPTQPPPGSVPEEVYAAIRKAVAFDPDERWASMTEFCAALRTCVRRRRSRWVWVAPSLPAAATLAALAFALRPATPALGPAEATAEATYVDRALESEAVRLVAQANELSDRAQRPEALGVSYAALTVAAASGSQLAQARAQLQLGASLLDIGDYARAAMELRTGVEMATGAGDDRRAAEGATRLIYAYGRLEQPDKALEVGRLARSLAKRSGDDGTLLARILGNEGSALTRDNGGAVDRYEEALALRLRTPGLDKPAAIAAIKGRLGAKLRYQDPERARALLTEAAAALTELHGPTHATTLETAFSLVALEANAGNADACVDLGLALFDRIPETSLRLRAATAHMLAVCYAHRDDFAEGLVWIKRAIDIGPDTEGSSATRRLEVWGILLGRTGQPALGEEKLQRAIVQIEMRAEGPDSSLATALINLSDVVLAGGDPARAEGYLRRAVAELEACESEDRELLFARTRLARFLLDAERFDEVVDMLRDDADPTQAPEPTRLDADRKGYARALFARALWEVTTVETQRARAVVLVEEALPLLEGSASVALKELAAELPPWLDARR